MLKSGEGLSLGFILLWMAGDITNLIGGAMAGLLPTMIILATYVSFLKVASSYDACSPCKQSIPAHTAMDAHMCWRCEDNQKSRQPNVLALSYGFEPGREAYPWA